MRARHRDEVLRSVESHGLVPQGSEVTEIAARSTTKIKDGKRRLALYRIKECRVILADILVANLTTPLRYSLGHDGVWTTTADDIAEYYIANH